MAKYTFSSAEKQTNPMYGFTDGIAAFLLTVCSLHCLISSFDLNANSFIVIICTAWFAGIFTAVSSLVENKKKYGICMGVIFAVFVLTVLFSLGTLASQLNYVINEILKIYSAFLDFPPYVRFAGIDNDSTALFVAASALLCGLFALFLIRMKFIFPVAAISLMVIFPCFVLINTLPDLLPLLGLFIVLFTLLISSAVHRINAPHTSAIVPVVAVFMAVLVTVVYILNPLEGYERSPWQEDLLAFTRASLGMESPDGALSSLTTHTKNIQKKVNLSNAGPLKKTNEKVMTVDSPYRGRVYLRSVAYANYENNTWSLLTDGQTENYPENFESLSMTGTSGLPRLTMNIRTEKADTILYTPYYLTEIPTCGIGLYDIFVKNDFAVQNYDVTFQPTSTNIVLVSEPYISYEENGDTVYYNFYYKDNPYDILPSESSRSPYFYTKNADALAYKDFVYETYLSVPANVKNEMINIATENGFAYQEKQEIINSVKKFVANSATYSLKTPKVPRGKDIALWLLNESETGYCVHFATAATLMLRSMGVPARYVSGYCFEADENDLSPTIISTDNAHAWVEYFDDDIGWVPLDATPADFTVPVYSPSAETTQPQTVAETTVAPTTTTQPATKPADKTPKIPSIRISTETVITIIIYALLLAVFAILLRPKLIEKLRNKKFTKGSPNQRAKHIYRYLLRITEYSHVSLPEEIVDIADKARFSGKQISQKELDIMLRFAKSRMDAMSKDSPILKKLYLRYILALI